jgi:hypothetical protein
VAKSVLETAAAGGEFAAAQWRSASGAGRRAGHRSTCASRPDLAAASLVIAAAEPWSTRTHALFPRAARARARLMLMLACRLARRAPPPLCARADEFGEIWLACVMPLVINRCDVSADPYVHNHWQHE